MEIDKPTKKEDKKNNRPTDSFMETLPRSHSDWWSHDWDRQTVKGKIRLADRQPETQTNVLALNWTVKLLDMQIIGSPEITSDWFTSARPSSDPQVMSHFMGLRCVKQIHICVDIGDYLGVWASLVFLVLPATPADDGSISRSYMGWIYTGNWACCCSVQKLNIGCMNSKEKKRKSSSWNKGVVSLLVHLASVKKITRACVAQRFSFFAVRGTMWDVSEKWYCMWLWHTH